MGRSVRAAALLCGLALLVSGCAGRIWVDQDNTEGIRLHWYTKEASIEDATARAREHCRPLGKEAVLEREFEDRDITEAVFACR